MYFCTRHRKFRHRKTRHRKLGLSHGPASLFSVSCPICFPVMPKNHTIVLQGFQLFHSGHCSAVRTDGFCAQHSFLRLQNKASERNTRCPVNPHRKYPRNKEWMWVAPVGRLGHLHPHVPVWISTEKWGTRILYTCSPEMQEAYVCIIDAYRGEIWGVNLV